MCAFRFGSHVHLTASFKETAQFLHRDSGSDGGSAGFY